MHCISIFRIFEFSNKKEDNRQINTSKVPFKFRLKVCKSRFLDFHLGKIHSSGVGLERPEHMFAGHRASVHAPLMPKEGAPLSEGATTGGTSKGFLTRVSANVILEGRAGGEKFATNFTSPIWSKLQRK